MVTEQMIKDCLYVKAQYDSDNQDSHVWEDYDFEYFNHETGWYCTRYDQKGKIIMRIRFENGVYTNAIK